MAVVLLVRHGLTAQTGPVLSGWTPALSLDDRGREQARRVAERLAELPLAAVVSSPLDRCRETATAVADAQRPRGTRRRPQEPPALQTDDRLGEVRYGDWTGRKLAELAREPLWRTVQDHPSAVTFPGGEALAAVQVRAVAALREHDARVSDEHGPDAVWVACSHGDVIKSVVADALGTHLDLFQRIAVDPCSVSAVRYTPTRPFVLRVNDTGGDVSALRPPARRRRRARGDAAVGGGAGAGGL